MNVNQYSMVMKTIQVNELCIQYDNNYVLFVCAQLINFN